MERSFPTLNIGMLGSFPCPIPKSQETRQNGVCKGGKSTFRSLGVGGADRNLTTCVELGMIFCRPQNWGGVENTFHGEGWNESKPSGMGLESRGTFHT